MKKATANALAIGACTALCALVWAGVPTDGEVTEQMPNAAVSAETATAESAPETTLSSDDEPVRITMQSEPNKDPEDLAAAEEATAMTITETEPIPVPSGRTRSESTVTLSATCPALDSSNGAAQVR